MKTAQKPDVIVHRLSVCEVWRDTLTESGSEADAFIRLIQTEDKGNYLIYLYGRNERRHS